MRLKKKKKLELNRQTIRSLDARELAQVKGDAGAVFPAYAAGPVNIDPPVASAGDLSCSCIWGGAEQKELYAPGGQGLY